VNLDEAIEVTKGFYESHYRRDPTFEIRSPFYVILRDGVSIGKRELNFPSRELNKLIRNAVAQAADAFGANMFLYVSEGWMNREIVGNEEDLEKDEEGLPMTGSIRDKPGSVEVLMIHAGMRSGRRVLVSWRIDRQAKPEEPILIESSRMDSDVDAESTFISHWDLWDRPSLRREMIIGDVE
jgi:hypothetical protein